MKERGGTMTDTQIEKLRKEVPQFINGTPCKLTEEQQQLHRELDCRDMINSCLCYGYDFLNSSYSNPYIIELGIDRVKQLYKEQKEDFDKATVLHNIGTDSEGNSYNSIVWADEIQKNTKEDSYKELKDLDYD